MTAAAISRQGTRDGERNEPHGEVYRPLKQDQQHECFACGTERPVQALEPFGYRGDKVASWICWQCLDATPVTLDDLAPTLEDAVLA